MMDDLTDRVRVWGLSFGFGVFGVGLESRSWVIWYRSQAAGPVSWGLRFFQGISIMRFMTQGVGSGGVGFSLR